MNLKLVLPIVIALGLWGTNTEYKKISVKPQDSINSNNTKNIIRLYPNPTTNGNVSVSSFTEAPVYFYVFDEEGTILHRMILQGKEKKTITDLKKGTYQYDVFLNDISVEQGKIIAK